MSASMTAPARWEMVDVLQQRYSAATREEKVDILTEFTSASGLHDRFAIRVRAPAGGGD